TDTGRRFESLVCDAFWNRYSVGIWYAAGIDIDITTGLLDAFERGTVYGQILQHRESCSSPRLDYDGLAIVKATHVQLTGSSSFHGAVMLTIDNKSPHPTHTLAAIVIKIFCNLTLTGNILVDNVEHFQE